MKSYILFFILFFVSVGIVRSQESDSRKGFTISAEYRYLTGKVYHCFSDKNFNWNSSTYEKNISIYAGYFFNPNLNINMGIGFDDNKYGLPLFLQSKYYFKEKKNSFYAAGEIAYRLIDKPWYYRGYDLSAFLGKELSISKRLAFNFHAGYNFHKAMFDIKSRDIKKHNYHNLLLGIAFSYK